ncbi:Tyrosine- phosphatase Lar [Paramuricea clavata]|uniref:Tyrosine- phosphatase Lar n=1 Tax=Paramuricea clavata TaxID=317549 RepID=A0A7D9ID31_PARCT|nr:Tyrosine- phosphatase Lar [Paramuricea clavata]
MLEFPEAAKRVMDDMYVDDCLTGADDKEEAVKLQKELTDGPSNTEDVLSHVEEKDRAPNALIDFREREPLKALGICWNTLTDYFEFHIPQNQFLLHECETKRNMLSDASKIFDPMGSPYTIRSKMLFQQLWNRGLQWDEQLPEDILQQWNAWKTELPKINEISLCRMESLKEAFPEEYERLASGKTLQRNSRILKLDLYIDKNSRTLRVEHLVDQGKTQSQEDYWIITCQCQRKGPLTQKMGPLPHERVSFSPPFTHVGVDFAGPLYVCDKTPKKAYMCIFTCASSRMVHIELVKDMSTNEFLQALSRMIGRRGLCKTMWSDNTKTFKSAEQKIRKLYLAQSSNTS